MMTDDSGTKECLTSIIIYIMDTYINNFHKITDELLDWQLYESLFNLGFTTPTTFNGFQRADLVEMGKVQPIILQDTVKFGSMRVWSWLALQILFRYPECLITSTPLIMLRTQSKKKRTFLETPADNFLAGLLRWSFISRASLTLQTKVWRHNEKNSQDLLTCEIY